MPCAPTQPPEMYGKLPPQHVLKEFIPPGWHHWSLGDWLVHRFPPPKGHQSLNKCFSSWNPLSLPFVESQVVVSLVGDLSEGTVVLQLFQALLKPLALVGAYGKKPGSSSSCKLSRVQSYLSSRLGGYLCSMAEKNLEPFPQSRWLLCNQPKL